MASSSLISLPVECTQQSCQVLKPEAPWGTPSHSSRGRCHGLGRPTWLGPLVGQGLHPVVLPCHGAGGKAAEPQQDLAKACSKHGDGGLCPRNSRQARPRAHKAEARSPAQDCMCLGTDHTHGSDLALLLRHLLNIFLLLPVFIFYFKFSILIY